MLYRVENARQTLGPFIVVTKSDSEPSTTSTKTSAKGSFSAAMDITEALLDLYDANGNLPSSRADEYDLLIVARVDESSSSTDREAPEKSVVDAEGPAADSIVLKPQPRPQYPRKSGHSWSNSAAVRPSLYYSSLQNKRSLALEEKDCKARDFNTLKLSGITQEAYAVQLVPVSVAAWQSWAESNPRPREVNNLPRQHDPYDLSDNLSVSNGGISAGSSEWGIVKDSSIAVMIESTPFNSARQSVDSVSLGLKENDTTKFDIELNLVKHLYIFEKEGTSAVYADIPVYGMETKAKSSALVEGSADGNQSLCVICLSSPSCIILYPCRHGCICRDCARGVSGGTNKCPICRERALLMIDVHEALQ